MQLLTRTKSQKLLCYNCHTSRSPPAVQIPPSTNSLTKTSSEKNSHGVWLKKYGTGHYTASVTRPSPVFVLQTTNTEVKSEHTWSSSLLSLIRSPSIPREMILVMRPDAVWLNPPPLNAYPLQEGMDQGHMMQRPKFKGHRQPVSNGIFDSQWHLHPAQSYSRAKDLGEGAIGHHVPLVCRIAPVME